RRLKLSRIPRSPARRQASTVLWIQYGPHLIFPRRIRGGISKPKLCPPVSALATSPHKPFAGGVGRAWFRPLKYRSAELPPWPSGCRSARKSARFAVDTTDFFADFPSFMRPGGGRS